MNLYTHADISTPAISVVRERGRERQGRKNLGSVLSVCETITILK